MSRYRGPKCKVCRRENEKLFLKGERCYSQKCAFERRSYPPGEHGYGSQYRRSRQSDFSRQLRAKQKARRIYDVSERQFRRYYQIALKQRGLTGFNLLQLLEMRLDNAVYRLGYAASRPQARMLVAHGHFDVNTRRTDVPSMTLSPGDEITVRETSKKRTFFKGLKKEAENRTPAEWVNRNLDNLSGKVVRLPDRSEISGSLDEQLIVEYYSR
ncbi:MAG: 30S ribosomal protein S4 [Chloroflexi bacterium]|nr:30S ribosomal protein S4 [Chloroflexota bacterium]